MRPTSACNETSANAREKTAAMQVKRGTDILQHKHRAAQIRMQVKRVKLTRLDMCAQIFSGDDSLTVPLMSIGKRRARLEMRLRDDSKRGDSETTSLSREETT